MSAALLTGAAVMPAELVVDGKSLMKIYHAPLSQEALPPEYAKDSEAAIKKFRSLEPGKQDEVVLATAIRDLNYHLKKMSGAELEVIVTDNPKDVKEPAIVIGNLAAKMGAAPKGGNEQSFRILVRNSNVLIGSRNNLSATYGIYELLNQLGCDWVMPGTEGEIIPEKKSVSITDLDATHTPGFSYRHMWYGGFNKSRQADYELNLWKIRMRQNITRSPDFCPGGHVWGELVKKYKDEFEKDKNMYALVRNSSGEMERKGPQVETTNPKVIDLAIRYIRETFEANKWEKDRRVCIAMGPADGGGVSESPESRNVGSGRMSPDSGKDDGTDLTVLFLNQILEKIGDEFPNLYLGFYLYSWHADYPIKHEPHPRIAIEIADINFSRFHGIGDESSKSRYYYKSIIEQWGRLYKKQGNPIIYRPYSWNLADGYLPFTKLKIWGEDIPFMKKTGVYGVLLNAYNDFAVNGAHTYLFVRMAWTPSLNWKQVLRHYCEKSFGKGADAMEKYYLSLVKRQSEAGQEAGCIFPYTLIYDQQFINDMKELLSDAEKMAKTPMDVKRVRYAALPMEHLQKYFNFRTHVDSLNFAEAKKIYKDINDGIDKANGENIHIVGFQGKVFLGSFFNKFLETGEKYSSGNYSIVYRIPERLKTALDRDSCGQNLNFFGRDINDSGYIETSTYNSTWDAQGLAGYRSGAVWYRVHFTLPRDIEDGHYGLFIGGADNTVSVWCNGKYIGSAGGGLFTPRVFSISGALEPGKKNLLAIQIQRIGNYELGTGGITLPCFIFKGPEIEAGKNEDKRPFRMLPGGVIEYIEGSRRL